MLVLTAKPPNNLDEIAANLSDKDVQIVKGKSDESPISTVFNIREHNHKT